MGDAQPTDAQAFAERLASAHRQKQCRDDRYIEQTDVAAALQVDPSNVSRWITGGQMPGDENMKALAQYFGITPGWLRYGHEPRETATAHHSATSDNGPDNGDDGDDGITYHGEPHIDPTSAPKPRSRPRRAGPAK